MWKDITSRLFIQRDHEDNHEVVVKIGPVFTEDDAINIATYIYVTQNLDITDIIKPANTTLH
jgi:hypothetical protein